MPETKDMNISEGIVFSMNDQFAYLVKTLHPY